MYILGENYDERYGLDEYDQYDPLEEFFEDDEYEDEYTSNHCFPQEW